MISDYEITQSNHPEGIRDYTFLSHASVTVLNMVTYRPIFSVN